MLKVKKDKTGKCFFCGKELPEKISGMIGDKPVCMDCGTEIADIVWHQLDLRIKPNTPYDLEIKSNICKKLDKRYH